MKHFFLLLCLLSLGASAPHYGKKVKLPKSFVYIPSGILKQGEKSLSIQGFYMQSTEVSNSEYRAFLAGLQQKGRTADYAIASVRPDGWRIPEPGLGSLAENYHEQGAYDAYPVVNISRDAALLYCSWLTENLQSQNPDYRIKVRLPLEAEWVYAAGAGHDDFPYPHGYHLLNAEGKFLYTFRQVGEENIHAENGDLTVLEPLKSAGSGGQNSAGPAPAKSGIPNGYGLYNTCGNAAEMLAEPGRTKGGSFYSTGYDIRIDAPDEYAGFTGASPFIGFRVVVSVVEK